MKLPIRKTAGIVLVACLALLAVFHVLVLCRIVPLDIVWGGRAGDGRWLVFLESVALAVTGLFLLTGAVKAGFIRGRRLKRAADILIWVMIVYFAANVAGNLAAGSRLEQAIFIPLLLVMIACSVVVAVKE
jgi:hypothetical protein